MRHQTVRTVFQFLLLSLVLCAILWKGGKALDAVWVTSLMSACFVFVLFAFRSAFALSLRSIPTHLFFSTYLFMVLTCVSFVCSMTKNYGLDEVFQTVSLCFIFLLIIALDRTDDLRRLFARVISVALLIAVGIGFFVYMYQPVSRFVGTFFDHRFHTDYWPNAWGEFFLLAWPMLLWTLFLRRLSNRTQLTLSAIVFGTALGGFFLSYSRGSFIAFAGQVLLLLISSFYHYRSAFAWRRVASLGFLSLVCSCVIFVSLNHLRSRHFPVESVVEKATFQSSEGVSSINERQLFFRQSISLLKMKPLIGYGPYAFRFIQPHVQTGVLQTSDHPHNVFLKFALERGVAASFLFLLILLFSLLPAIRCLLFRRSDPETVLTLLFLVSVLGVLAHNLIDFNLQFVGIALPFWILLAFLSTSHSNSDFAVRKSQRSILCVSALLFAVVVIGEGAFLGLSSLARHSEARGDTARALEYYVLTEHSVFPRDAWLSRSALFLQQKRYQDALGAVSVYMDDNSADARGWRLLGDIYLAWNKRDEALRAYEKAFEYGKWNDAGIIRGLVYLLRSDRTALKDLRHEVDMLLNEYAYSIEHNEHFIALGFNVEEVASLAEILAEIFPSDRLAYRSLIDRVTTHALKERSVYSSRATGYLW